MFLLQIKIRVSTDGNRHSLPNKKWRVCLDRNYALRLPIVYGLLFNYVS